MESASMKRYGRQLLRLVNDQLDELGVASGRIEIVDRGALDYCLRARLVCAVERGMDHAGSM